MTSTTMKFHKLLAIGLVVILPSGLLQAQAPAESNKRNLSIKEAIDLCKQNSAQLKLSRYKTEEAEAQIHEMRNHQLPDLKASGSYLRLSSPTIDSKIKLGGSSSSGSGEQSAGKPTVNQAAYTLINTSLPLFAGFKIKYGIESAKYVEKAAQLDEQTEEDELVLNVINAYSNLYKAWQTIGVLKENLQQQNTRLTDFEHLEQNGIISHNDLLKAQLQKSNIQLALLDAETNYTTVCYNMSLMMGLAQNQQFIPDSLTFTPSTEPLTAWQQTAIENRKDMALIDVRQKAAEYGLKATKSDYFPALAVTGGYVAADIPNIITITNAFNVGIGLQYNIASIWKTPAKVESAQSKIHQLEAMRGITHDKILMQSHQAYQNYVYSLSKVEVYAKAVEQATENQRIAENKYKSNLITTSDLLEAQITTLQANMNYKFAQTDSYVAYKKLQHACGKLSY
ncbi:MAG: TolC family protein [Chitinophagia bacterium]|nr:TolC family protein [Chitinophagia bacterium]